MIARRSVFAISRELPFGLEITVGKVVWIEIEHLFVFDFTLYSKGCKIKKSLHKANNQSNGLQPNAYGRGFHLIMLAKDIGEWRYGR